MSSKHSPARSFKGKRSLVSAGAIAVLVALSAGCVSLQRSLPENIPGAVPTTTVTDVSTARPSSTPQIAAEAPPPKTAPATTDPLSQKTQEAETCRDPGGQLTVGEVNSAVLARRVPYSLYLPPCYKIQSGRLYPVLYLLHGINTDHTQWPDLNVQSDADALIGRKEIVPLVVVMPGGDYRAGEDYGAFLIKDLMPQIERAWNIASDRQHRAIGGLSQGGFWALDLALLHPELFSAVGGHSTATSSALTDLLAPDRLGQLNDLRIYLDVGDQDPLLSGVAALVLSLRSHGLTPIFHIYPGAHNRPYWRSHTAEYLAFYAANW